MVTLLPTLGTKPEAENMRNVLLIGSIIILTALLFAAGQVDPVQAQGPTPTPEATLITQQIGCISNCSLTSGSVTSEFGTTELVAQTTHGSAKVVTGFVAWYSPNGYNKQLEVVVLEDGGDVLWATAEGTPYACAIGSANWCQYFEVTNMGLINQIITGVRVNATDIFGQESLTRQPLFASITINGHAIILLPGGSDECDDYQLLPGSGTSAINVADENGEVISDTVSLEAGKSYVIQTYRGPWYDDGGRDPQRFDAALSRDSGETWNEMGEGLPSSGAVCVTTIGDYTRAIMNVENDDVWKIRVNDTPTNFLDNEGTLSFIVTEVTTDTTRLPVAGEDNLTFTDGGMETTSSTGWQMPTNLDYWGRIINNTWQAINYPSALCGVGSHHVGDPQGNINLLGRDDDHRNLIQEFYWPGGEMFYRFSVRNNKTIWQILERDEQYYTVVISRLNGGPGDGTGEYVYSDSATVTATWKTVTGSIPFVYDGYYRIELKTQDGCTYYDWFSACLDDQNNEYGVMYDDVWISRQPRAACDTTEFNAPTPTPGTPQPTSTPETLPTSSVPDINNTNCGFEYGYTGWNFTSGSMLVYPVDSNELSPIGGSYALITSDQPNPQLWAAYVTPLDNGPNGQKYIYINFFAKGYWAINVRSNTGQSLYSSADFSGDWEYIENTLLIPNSITNIVLELSKYQQINIETGAAYDGVIVTNKNGGNIYCVSDGITPTIPPPPTATNTVTPGGPTATSTATRIFVPTHTITPFPTWTPKPTFTPTPTWTLSGPQETATSFYATSTAYAPTLTPVALTETAFWATATAQGTPQPPTPEPTYTATSVYVEPTSTPMPPTPTPPEQQPPGACNADCQRPRGMDNLNLAEWQEYLYCEGTSYIAVCPYHAATMAAIPTLVANREPFSTINEIQGVWEGLSEQINQYDWENTGISGSKNEPNLATILTPDPNSIYSGGSFSLDDSTNRYDDECEWMIGNITGSALGDSMCWAWNIMEYYGYTPWMSFMVTISSIILLIMYLVKKWADTTASA